MTSDQPEPVTPADITIWEYAWSPDGQQFAVYYSAGPGETDWYRGQVGIVPAEGGAVRRLTQLTRQAAALAWSPDSSRIAYISGEWSDRGLVGGEVFVIPAAGGEPRNLTPGVEFSPSWVRWFPDGARMLYAGWDGVAHQVGLLDEASGARTPALARLHHRRRWRAEALNDTRPAPLCHPLLRPAAPVRCLGRRAFRRDWRGRAAGMAASHPSQRADRGDDAARARRGYHLGERRRLADRGAYSRRPLSATRGSPPPLVVQVHGGPSAAWQTDWRGGVMWGQICASAGFAVLQPNIRGGLGRGIAFADAVLGDAGGKDLQDILSGIDYLVAQRAGGWRASGHHRLELWRLHDGVGHQPVAALQGGDDGRGRL